MPINRLFVADAKILQQASPSGEAPAERVVRGASLAWLSRKADCPGGQSLRVCDDFKMRAPHLCRGRRPRRPVLAICNPSRIAVALACGERVKFATQTLRAIRESPLRVCANFEMGVRLFRTGRGCGGSKPPPYGIAIILKLVRYPLPPSAREVPSVYEAEGVRVK